MPEPHSRPVPIIDEIRNSACAAWEIPRGLVLDQLIGPCSRLCGLRRREFILSFRVKRGIFPLFKPQEREIPRFARNDKRLGELFRTLFRRKVANAAIRGRDYAWLIVDLNRLASDRMIELWIPTDELRSGRSTPGRRSSGSSGH
jgi:hypothetical protein